VIHWLTTAPNPRSPATGFDAGQRGWRVHAVEAHENFKFSELNATRHPALCGVVPAHGWGMDLFIERRCARCERKLGLPLSAENEASAGYRKELKRKTKE
jgi:hypothetical protein